MAFQVYLVFIISYLLRIPARIPFLGSIRFDLLLLSLIVILLLFKGRNLTRLDSREADRTMRFIIFLCGYIVFTIPFARWPGTALLQGIPAFIKAVVFFFFTIATVDSTKRLRMLLLVFLLCQLFRVIEPLYLNVTQGYWGSAAHLGGAEFMDRLAGGPSDVINPNGLAFVIVSILPFLHYLAGEKGKFYKLLYVASLPALGYALVLTGSRSGLVALLVVFFGFFLFSRRKALMSVFFIGVAIAGIASMDTVQRDRYLSIFSENTANAKTAEDRLESIKLDFMVAMDRPVFGHGIGTSVEANTHVRSTYRISHNLYAEVSQELGFVGLVIFLGYVLSIARNALSARRVLRTTVDSERYLFLVNEAMIVWLMMYTVFSFASYGLSTYGWYFFGGLAVALIRLVDRGVDKPVPDRAKPMTHSGRSTPHARAGISARGASEQVTR